MKTLKKIAKWLGIGLGGLALVAVVGYWLYVRPALQRMEPTQTIAYDPQLTIITGGGGNSGLLTSDSLVVVIDTKMGEAAKTLAAEANRLATGKRLLVINTHFHSDHTGGNAYYSNPALLAGGRYPAAAWRKEAGLPLPTRRVLGQQAIRVGNETVVVYNLPYPAHTESDVVVYLTRRRLLFTGDVVLHQQVPAMVSAAASPAGYLRALSELPRRFDLAAIVPGHGAVGDTTLLTDFRQYFRDMQTAAQDAAQTERLTAKYADWNQIPLVMSPAATIKKLTH